VAEQLRIFFKKYYKAGISKNSINFGIRFTLQFLRKYVNLIKGKALKFQVEVTGGNLYLN